MKNLKIINVLISLFLAWSCVEQSELPSEIDVAVTTADKTPPTTPTDVISTSISANSITLSWTGSEDDTAILSYEIYRNGDFLNLTVSNTFSDFGLSSETNYLYSVRAIDTSLNKSPFSNNLFVSTSADEGSATNTADEGSTTSAPDIAAPSIPSNLSSSEITKSSVIISWGSSSDNIAVSAYKIYRNNTFLAASPTTSFLDFNLTASTSYTYKIKAIDSNSNESGFSSELIINTLAEPVSTTIFSDVSSYAGDMANWQANTESSWSLVEEASNKSMNLVNSEYTSLSGERLGEVSLLKDKTFDNFTFIVKAKSLEDLSANSYADYGIVFAYVDANNYSYMLFNSSAASSQLHQVKAGTRSLLQNATDLSIGDNNFHQIKIEKDGTKVSVSYDGVEKLSYNGINLGSGSIGVGAYNDAAAFDDIGLTALPDSVPTTSTVPETETSTESENSTPVTSVTITPATESYTSGLYLNTAEKLASKFNSQYSDSNLPTLQDEYTLGNKFSFNTTNWIVFYIDMHKLTQDSTWLNRAKTTIDFMFNHTDEKKYNRGQFNYTYNAGPDSVFKENPFVALKGWSRDYGSGGSDIRAEILENGNICRHIMMFVDYVRTNNISGYETNGYITSCSSIIKDFDSNYVANRYSTPIIDGAYYYPSTSTKGSLWSNPVPFNHNAVGAEAALLIYKYTNDSAHLEKALQIRDYLLRNFREVGNYYEWNYLQFANGSYREVEDVNHSSYDVHFLYVLWKEGYVADEVITRVVNTVPVFMTPTSCAHNVAGEGTDDGGDWYSSTHGYLNIALAQGRDDIMEIMLKSISYSHRTNVNMWHARYRSVADVLAADKQRLDGKVILP